MIETKPMDFQVTPVLALELTSQDAQELNSLIYRKVRETEQSFYELGDMLYVAWRGEIHLVLGVDTWEQWLAGMRLTKGAASDMIRTKELRLAYPDYEPRILDTNPSNIRLLLPHLKQDLKTRAFSTSPDELDGYLDKANTHSWRQLNDDLNNDIDPVESERCPTCHQIWRKP